MKKYLPAINFVFTIILFGFIIYLLNKISNINFTIRQFSSNNDFVKNIGMDWISSRISDNLTFTISFVAIIFTLLSIIVIFGIKDFIQKEINNKYSKINKANKKIKKHKKEIIKLRNDLSNITILLSVKDLTPLFTKENLTKDNHIHIVELALTVIDNLLNQKQYSKAKIKAFLNTHIDAIKTSLAKNNLDLPLIYFKLQHLENIKSKIDKHCDTETKRNFAAIYSLIKFKDEQ